MTHGLARAAEEAAGKLDPEERKVFEYFYTNVSVGEIIALRELSARYKVPDPEAVIRRLIDKGLLERGEGCYNLAKSLREARYAESMGKRGWG
jgi:hypothetical protein